MTRLFRSRSDADHDRARDLAALRLDEPMGAEDAAWLDGHLEFCDGCREIAAQYLEGRLLLRGLLDAAPEPPRDLWARTAAAIEAEGSRGSHRVAREGPRGWLSGPMTLAPVAGLLVVAIAVGAGLFNGVALFPAPGVEPGDTTAAATPFPLTAGDVRVLALDADGALVLRTKQIDEVCPVGADDCEASGASDTTALGDIGSLESFEAVLSPGSDQVVLMERGEGASGVFVVPVRTTTEATPVPATTTPEPPTSPVPTRTPDTSPEPSASPEASPSPDASASPEPSPSAEPPASPEVTPEPSVAVTAAPDGALEIAHDVILVGSTSGYSPDGSRFAFTARPADGSTGPDVYVWQTTDAEARPVTDDHASVFSGWAGRRMLVSRAIDGESATVLLDPASGDVEAIPNAAAWRPSVAPDGRVAAWWDGTLERGGDGHTWQPAAGRLVLGAWPETHGKPQVLATGRFADWDVHWDDDGSVLGVWTSREGAGRPGRLSLYAVDPETGLVDLDSPLLDETPAFGDFSLRTGRLAWNAPGDDGQTVLKVLAWSGDNRGELLMPTEGDVTIVR